MRSLPKAAGSPVDCASEPAARVTRHMGMRNWLTGWRRWRAYRARLSALYQEAERDGYKVSPATYERLVALAREQT